ncbi:hypothetical protein VTP01DRAFT_979 [Rhizomucor pusillus]|uniref:uncharacterized protein n=1 Tax=Rhizomucor pusillus TaxID=4840 RepID=UPI0037441BAB
MIRGKEATNIVLEGLARYELNALYRLCYGVNTYGTFCANKARDEPSKKKECDVSSLEEKKPPRKKRAHKKSKKHHKKDNAVQEGGKPEKGDPQEPERLPEDAVIATANRHMAQYSGLKSYPKKLVRLGEKAIRIIHGIDETFEVPGAKAIFLDEPHHFGWRHSVIHARPFQCLHPKNASPFGAPAPTPTKPGSPPLERHLRWICLHRSYVSSEELPFVRTKCHCRPLLWLKMPSYGTLPAPDRAYAHDLSSTRVACEAGPIYPNKRKLCNPRPPPTTTGAFRDRIYWFIAIFLAHFQLRFLFEAPAELLMKFINAIIEAFCARISQATGAATEPLFHLPTKLSTLRKYADYGTVASNIIRYVVCPTCHKTFEMDEFRLDRVVDAVDEILCDRKEFPLRNLSTCVDELVQLYTGVSISLYGEANRRIRAALLMIGCDIPAARKVSGFTDIASVCACYKCKRQFPNAPGNNLKRDFSGFRQQDISTWDRRNGEESRVHAEAWRRAANLDEGAAIEGEHGARWSELYRLSYFRAVRCTIIDPMHNLYSSTAKRVFNLWKMLVDAQTNRPLLSARDFEKMADQMGNTILPCGYIPKGKLASGGTNFASDEWRTWTLAVSPRLLKEKSVGAHMWKWLKLVEANYILPKPSISLDEVDAAHESLRQFCEGYEALYGKEEITPKTNKDGFEATFIQKFLEKYSAANNLQHLQLSESAISVLTSLIPSLASVSSTSEDQSLPFFDIATFDQLATDRHSTCIGWEPLPPTLFSGPKMTDMIRLGKAHYDCLMGYYAGVYLNLCAEGVTSTKGKTMKPRKPEKQKDAYTQAYLSVDPETGSPLENPSLWLG